MPVISCPAFSELDREIVEDFFECLQENIESIELCLGQLDNDPSNVDLINKLFRDVHSFKGNCRMVFLDPVVEAIHTLEEVVSDMRQGAREYHSVYREFVSEVIFRLVNLIKEVYVEKEISSDLYDLILSFIKRIHDASSKGAIEVAKEAVAQLTGEPRVSSSRDLSSAEASEPQDAVSEDDSDLSFFKKLADQADGLNPHRKDRTKTILELCLETNRDLGSVVCEKQLTAAVYLHDLGMTLVPRGVLEKPGRLTHDEFLLIQGHVEMGAQMLSRIPGWEEASQIVFQHHEKYDGSGYPMKLKGDDIHPGAMIVSLADTYYAVTNERADRSYKKSLFSAVSLINGESGMQFNPQFVEGFNEAVRRLYVGRT